MMQNINKTIKKYLAISGKSFLERIKYLIKNFPQAENSFSIYYKYIKPEIDQANFVLDAGCGRGIMTAKTSAKKIWGIDLHPPAIKYAASHFNDQNRLYFIANLEQMPFKLKSFDVILAFNVIEHLKYPDLTFKEFGRMINDKKGKLIIFTPNILNPFYFLNKLCLSLFGRRLTNLFFKRKNRTPTFYRTNHILLLDLKLNEKKFKRIELIRGIDPPALDNKFYLFFWKNLNKIFLLKPFRVFLPVFCAIYVKKS